MPHRDIGLGMLGMHLIAAGVVRQMTTTKIAAESALVEVGSGLALPDRFSINPDSEFHDPTLAGVNIGVRFDGSDRPNDVEEYCVSEGWIRVQMRMTNGKLKRERGKVVCLKRFGRVEPYRR